MAENSSNGPAYLNARYFSLTRPDLLLRPLVGVIYGDAFLPSQLAAVFGGASVVPGFGTLFATQMYTAAAKGTRLAPGWLIALVVALAFLVMSDLEPITRTAAAFGVGEATGILLLGVALAERRPRAR